MKISEIINSIEEFAPLQLQEDYDNSGLQVGDKNVELCGILIALDITEEVIDEAILLGTNLIISHHPLIFKGLKRIGVGNMIERIIRKAIKADIVIYSAHTNLDFIRLGVNSIICEKLGIQNPKPLVHSVNQLIKLVTFVPEDFIESLSTALFEAGAGHIGNYDSCSFQSRGQGTFRGLESSNPFVGQKGKLHFEDELRLEMIFPKYIENKVVNALIASHPYEEVAFDLIPVNNVSNQFGIGLIGELPSQMSCIEFLSILKKEFKTGLIRHSSMLAKEVKTVAVCGGSGSSFLQEAIRKGADVYVSADFKYHNFFDAEGKIMIADIGLFESEQFTVNLLSRFLLEKFPTFAPQISGVVTNPINYF
jgi:dinuclear metal center YbgI/SA1388 family protein